MSSSGQKFPGSLLQSLTDEDGLAIVVVDEKSKTIAESNNNSICRALYSSNEFAPRCAEFCGQVFQMTAGAGKKVDYECYAGLSCSAVPLTVEGKLLTAIVGRTFLKAANYQAATERAISGDWSIFSPSEFFENVLLSGSTNHLEKTVKRISNLSDAEKAQIADNSNAEKNSEVKDSPIQNDAQIERKTEREISQTASNQQSQADEIAALAAQFHRDSAKINYQNKIQDETVVNKNREETSELTVWRSLFGALLKLNYRQACEVVIDFLEKRYDLDSLMWLERREDKFETILATGALAERNAEIGVAVNDERLLDAAQREISLELRERQKDEMDQRQTINLFPVAVGGEIRSALVVGDELKNAIKIKRLAHFCHTVAAELEILRLREELLRRDWLTRAVRKFNEGLKKIDTDDFWLNLTRISAELLRVERASLLIYDEKKQILHARAAIGAPEDLTADKEIGKRVAGKILSQGEPLIALSTQQIGVEAAPPQRNYKTDSFIVFPISIGERKIAALNFTDRIGSEAFNQLDLELLQAIAPQIAVAIDRANLQTKAGELEQRSVTDALTQLLNRRYLDERLIEEIKRSNRYGYPMSLLLIDIDDFGRFNKDFGILVGDEVLRQTVKAMVSTLRGADIAARYGGEEFCVLLPQTTLSEARLIAERIRQSVEKIDFPQRKITISIGVTTFTYEVSTPQAIIKTADDALRQAKRGGKNNVQIYGNLSESLIVEDSGEQRENSI